MVHINDLVSFYSWIIKDKFKLHNFFNSLFIVFIIYGWIMYILCKSGELVWKLNRLDNNIYIPHIFGLESNSPACVSIKSSVTKRHGYKDVCIYIWKNLIEVWQKKRLTVVILLKAINKQSSNTTNTNKKAYDDSNGQICTSTNSLPCLHIIPCKPLLWCSALRARILVRLHAPHHQRYKNYSISFRLKILQLCFKLIF